MIKLTYMRLLAVLSLAALIIISCDKNDDNAANGGKAELLSFGPTGAKHGDTLRFIGNNLTKVTSIQFTGGASAVIDQKDFKTQTSELIKVIVPAAAEKGLVTLKTSDGDIVTKTQLNLNVLSTVATMTQQARPGTNVTINGDYLNWIDRVTFNKDKVVTSFVTKTKNQLVVKVPDDAQTGPLILHYGGTDSADVQTKDTLKVTLPLITSMSPVPVKPQTNLTITGTDLDLAKKVIFNGVSTPVTSFVSQSATQIVVAVPATAKKGKLTLEAASGVQTQSVTDLDIVLPTATALSPNPISLGANLTITGTDLDLTSKVIFSGVAAAVTTFVSKTATQLVVRVPAGARDGKVKLEAASTVQTTSASDLDIVLPSVTNMSPSPVDPGANLTITGTQLDLVSSINFQNAAPVTSFVSQSANQIVVTVPNGVLRGKIILGISNPTDTVHSSTILEITGDPPPPTIAFPFYTDALTSNWTNNGGWLGGGWGGNKDLNNTSVAREGTKSIKIDYVGGWGSPLQLGRNAGSTINVSSYTTFKISIYGGPGTNGKRVALELNKVDAKEYPITLVEGKWTDYAIPLSTLMSSTDLFEIWLKEYNGTGGFTIYVDAVGVD